MAIEITAMICKTLIALMAIPVGALLAMWLIATIDMRIEDWRRKRK